MDSGDLDRVLEIATGLEEAPQWPRLAYADAWMQSPAAGVAMVAEDAEELGVAGFAVAALVPPEAELETIAVAAEFQRRGVARRAFFGELLTELRRRVSCGSHAGGAGLEQRRRWAFYGLWVLWKRADVSGYYADPVEDACSDA